jgi:hypothetical protein
LILKKEPGHLRNSSVAPIHLRPLSWIVAFGKVKSNVVFARSVKEELILAPVRKIEYLSDRIATIGHTPYPFKRVFFPPPTAF